MADLLHRLVQDVVLGVIVVLEMLGHAGSQLVVGEERRVQRRHARVVYTPVVHYGLAQSCGVRTERNIWRFFRLQVVGIQPEMLLIVNIIVKLCLVKLLIF